MVIKVPRCPHQILSPRGFVTASDPQVLHPLAHATILLRAPIPGTLRGEKSLPFCSTTRIGFCHRVSPH